MRSNSVAVVCGSKPAVSTGILPHESAGKIPYSGRMKTGTLLQRVEQRLAELGLSAREASLIASDGKNAEVIRNIRRGKSENPRGDTINGLALALQSTVEWLLTGHGPKEGVPPKLGEAKPQPNVDIRSIRTEGLVGDTKDLPIYSCAQGGPTGMTITFEPIEYVKRPEPLMDVKGGFGMYVVGESMEPVYRQGDMLLVHPHKPVGRGDDVLVVKSDGNGQHDAMVKTLVSMDDKRVKVKQYKPAQEFDIPREEIHGVYLIVGNYRRR